MSSTRREELARAAGLGLFLIGCTKSEAVATPTPVRRPAGPPLIDPRITPPSVRLGPEQLRPENIYVPLGPRSFVNYRGGGIASTVDGPVKTEANPAIMASLRVHPGMGIPLAENELIFSVLSHRPLSNQQDETAILADLQRRADDSEHLTAYYREMSQRGLVLTTGTDVFRHISVYQRLKEPLASYQTTQPISQRYYAASVALSLGWVESLVNSAGSDRKRTLSDTQRTLVEQRLPIRVVAMDEGVPGAIRSLPDLPS
ncbi:hypothetical protein A2631_00115 [Candidatus Daviesbacteria bacterium RIFCSPHIGHO2_01_FULL_44_29]|uniref:Uncharacterized protein n=1 Tax=Candidatus Daviesbacteria bacterium RIFCSPHIGHO2_02_FULL_43_12 TaxID=1797776 RepID=A0A1F5KIB8_9BACT|nr:MAG: hypothetical protein A2631_00115 [Candidatus Daviesbacteria bacterium RIFCSPHIGHO2_01_FULL_44_29]OGE40560.1 MAG: hypothetical protein A3D25_00380 [Candidatus Daviesbacteria bacterium RIFCSPHIGHO2_02_FULL_43_12]OGE40922.1 MAG: hypothetical protein A3E86_05540 [Candidatus Daviesbacteria bacterium RIFCSPHIGHO2_12_FULL_47_45]OGE70120.1 MAG: hypothetical protein A3B55_00150 [Candidatus Daviesbacteria bacterium RIFCSPLOWO2_01_FULL_43_15]